MYKPEGEIWYDIYSCAGWRIRLPLLPTNISLLLQGTASLTSTCWRTMSPSPACLRYFLRRIVQPMAQYAN